MRAEDFKGKKVLVMGLGTLGGGIATAKWFIKHGASVTVTDLRAQRELASSIRALGTPGKRVRLVLDRHAEADFRTHDLVVVNPAVPRESKFLKVARRAGKSIVNDARIFFDLAPNPTVAVTGTRGKTTTTNWIAHFLHSSDSAVFAVGNTPERPLFADLDRLVRRPETPAVLELSSWQLELVRDARRGPDVAVITNLYPDHLNRYRKMEDYAEAKSAIFQGQNPAQALILNGENRWTPFFLKIKPKGRLFIFTMGPLPRNTRGISITKGAVIFTEAGKTEVVAGPKLIRDFQSQWGTHNVENLLAAMLAAHLMGLPWHAIVSRIASLPGIPFRQETVIRQKNLLVVNDSAGTSPDATIAALKRFRGPDTYLVTGGTDKKLEFRGLARVMKTAIPSERVFFLNGSATKKLLFELKRVGFSRNHPPQIFEDLPTILHAVSRQLPITQLPITILFSPGAASFEKFKNEFDRGKQFTRAARRAFGHV